MKSLYTTGLRGMTFLLCVFLTVYSSCSKPPVEEPPVVEPTAAEKTTALLKGAAWVMSSVKVDDVVIDLYKGLSVVFTADGKYTSVSGGVVWPASGTWKFKDDTAKVMIREDGLEITIESLTATAMTISFTRTGETVFQPGRNSAVAGKHVLTMGR